MKKFDILFRIIAIIQMIIIGVSVSYLYGYYRGQNSQYSNKGNATKGKPKTIICDSTLVQCKLIKDTLK